MNSSFVHTTERAGQFPDAADEGSGSLLALLREARELISDKERWITGDPARNSDGLSTNSDDPEAICWCSLGAIWKVARRKGISSAEGEGLLRYAMGRNIADFNDAHSHEEVLAAWDAAIANAARAPIEGDRQ